MLSVWKVTLDKMAEVCAIGGGNNFCLSQNVFSHQATWIRIILQMSNLFLIFWLAEPLYCKSLRSQHEAFNIYLFNIQATIRHLYKLEVGTLPPPGQKVERAPAILSSFLTRTSLWGSDQENNFWALPKRFNYLEIINSNNSVYLSWAPYVQRKR